VPKVKAWDIDPDEPEELETFDTYDGPVPPKGIYRCRIKWIQLKENKNGDRMFSILAEIAEPNKSEKSEYNGYAIWNNLNVTNQGKPYVMNFLSSLGITWKDFLNKTNTADTDLPSDVIQMGKVKFPAHDSGNTPYLRVNAKRGKDMAGEPALVVNGAGYLPDKGSSDDDDGDDEDGDDKPPF
jgi:hypothetical protein